MNALGIFGPIAWAFGVMVLLAVGALFGSVLTQTANAERCDACRARTLCDLAPTREHVTTGPVEHLDIVHRLEGTRA